jgi:pyruvate kinase
MKRTKIIATLGPATNSKEKIKQLISSGMNVARINFSHGDLASNGELIKHVKELRKELDASIGIMADLQGPRIRTVVSDDLDIKKGEKIHIFDLSLENAKYKIPDTKYFSLDWPGIIGNIEVGSDILIEDGLIRLKVTKKEKTHLVGEVIEGGMIKNHKGVNIPDVKLNTGAVTKKDEKDLEFLIKEGVDFIALSFVSNAKEIEDTRKKIKNILGQSERLPHIIAKIERKEAIKNISEIIKASDGVMVARGDLGIELDESRVVIYQKEIIALCLRAATPVIVATQMLNSMIESSRPTRAEVSDVSNAVIDHADSVMLSGETANGKHPVEAVKVMKDIINKTERSRFDVLAHGFLGDRRASISSAVAHSAHELSRDVKAKAIVAASVSGYTARMVARHRPEKTIYVMTNNFKTHNQLSLVWGVESYILPDCRTLDELIDRSIETLKNKKIIQAKDKVIIVAGRPHIAKEHMSLVKIEEIE